MGRLRNTITEVRHTLPHVAGLTDKGKPYEEPFHHEPTEKEKKELKERREKEWEKLPSFPGITDAKEERERREQRDKDRLKRIGDKMRERLQLPEVAGLTDDGFYADMKASEREAYANKPLPRHGPRDKPEPERSRGAQPPTAARSTPPATSPSHVPRPASHPPAPRVVRRPAPVYAPAPVPVYAPQPVYTRAPVYAPTYRYY
jgi:hypothetical protein